MSQNVYPDFKWWIGCVENRHDPLKMGRCQVRVIAYHTDDKTLLPTEDLPWALAIQPITSAAISGIGSAPIGPVEGTWVVGWWMDGLDMQQPAFFGTIGGIASADKTFKKKPEKQSVNNLNQGILKDSQGRPVLDENGKEIVVGTPSVSGWTLGQTSEKYESGGKGPGVINAYNGAASSDYGGASYGCYQFASYLPKLMPNGKARPSSNNSPCLKFVSTCRFSDKFSGLSPATPEFDVVWKQIASTNPKEFKEDQHEYIKKNYYEVMLSNLARNGYDLTKFGPAVHDLIWSTAVQLGPGKTSVFTVPLRNKTELTDRQIVELVSQYKVDMVNSLFASSSPSIKQGVVARYNSEKSDLLKLITV